LTGSLTKIMGYMLPQTIDVWRIFARRAIIILTSNSDSCIGGQILIHGQQDTHCTKCIGSVQVGGCSRQRSRPRRHIRSGQLPLSKKPQMIITLNRSIRPCLRPLQFTKSSIRSLHAMEPLAKKFKSTKVRYQQSLIRASSS
jgi:hypothetical protein